jgi:hypothetical protein
MSDGKLRAWIEQPEDKQGVIAAFVGVPPRSDNPIPRLPATRRCASLTEARQWVEPEAHALGGVQIEWVGKVYDLLAPR